MLRLVLGFCLDVKLRGLLSLDFFFTGSRDRNTIDAAIYSEASCQFFVCHFYEMFEWCMVFARTTGNRSSEIWCCLCRWLRVTKKLNGNSIDIATRAHLVNLEHSRISVKTWDFECECEYEPTLENSHRRHFTLRSMKISICRCCTSNTLIRKDLSVSPTSHLPPLSFRLSVASHFLCSFFIYEFNIWTADWSECPLVLRAISPLATLRRWNDAEIKINTDVFKGIHISMRLEIWWADILNKYGMLSV